MIFEGVALSGPRNATELASPARFKVLRYLKGRGPDVVDVATQEPSLYSGDHSGVFGAMSGIVPFETGDSWRIFGAVPKEAGNSARLGVRSDRICGASRQFPSEDHVGLRHGPRASARSALGPESWKAELMRGDDGLACLRLWLPYKSFDEQCDLLDEPGSLIVAAGLATGNGGDETGVAVAGAGLVSFELRSGERAVSKTVRGAEGLAVTTLPGYVDPDSFEIVGRFADGSEKVLDRAARRATVTGPPVGTFADREWEAIAEPSYPTNGGLTCTRWDIAPSGLRSLGRYGLSIELRYGVCGDLGSAPIYYAVREFLSYELDRAEYTAVFGAVAPEVVSVAVEGPDGTRSPPLSDEGRAFITVFGGEVPAEDLTLRAELADGSEVVFQGARDAHLGSPRTPWRPGPDR